MVDLAFCALVVAAAGRVDRWLDKLASRIGKPVRW